MLNPDGVALGNYRCSLMGFDLNRHWRDTNPWAQPGLHAVKSFLVSLERETPVDFCYGSQFNLKIASFMLVYFALQILQYWHLIFVCIFETIFDPGVSFDIHAHSLATGAFMYGNVVDEQHQNEQQTLPRIFSAHAEDFSLSRTNFNKDAVSYFIFVVISYYNKRFSFI